MIRRRPPGASEVGGEPARPSRGYEDLVAEVSREVPPPRGPRNDPRVVKCSRVKWPGKKTVEAPLPRPGRPFAEAIALVELPI